MSLGVVLPKWRHELNQGIDAFNSHSVVETCSAAHRCWSFHWREEVEKASRGSLSDEPLLQRVVVTDSERNVHSRTVSSFDLISIVTISGVDIVVEKCGASDSICLHYLDATLVKHVGDVETADVDGPAWRSVVENVRCFREGFPVTEERSITAVASDQIVFNDNKCDASRSDILRSAGIDNSVLLPINRLWADVWGHVTDQDLALWHLFEGEIMELQALDCLVGAVVEEFCTGVNVPFFRVWNSRIITVVSGNLVGFAVLLSLLESILWP